jgi:hypothetical protein
MAKCSACNGTPNVIHVFPNVSLNDYDPEVKLSPYRGPTCCSHCRGTGIDPEPDPIEDCDWDSND